MIIVCVGARFGHWSIQILKASFTPQLSSAHISFLDMGHNLEWDVTHILK